MKQSFKTLLYFLLYYSGIEKFLARRLRADATAVLMFHGVISENAESALPPAIDFHLDAAAFRRLMHCLTKRYQVVPLDELIERLRAGKPLEKRVVLTFDDGYRNNARVAAPVLAGYGLPYTIFMATAYVEDPSRWMPLNELYALWAAGRLGDQELNQLRRRIRSGPMRETLAIAAEYGARLDEAARARSAESFAMMSWDEARALAEAGADFGSHTHTHCNLRVEPAGEQQNELDTSKRLIESRLKRPVRSFAYPYGHAEHRSPETRARVASCGYECAITADHGLVTAGTDPYGVPRLGYDRRVYYFAGELLYQFARHRFRSSRRRSA